MTEALYFDQPLTFEFTAQVLDLIPNNNQTFDVILDKTYFYPTGGGQSHDKGTLGNQAVLDVRKEAGTIIHIVDGKIETGEVVGKINEAHRRGNMQAHTGQHILSAVFLKHLTAETLAVKMNPTGLSTVDVSVSDLTQEQIDAVEDLANGVIMDNREVKSYFVPSDSPKLNDLRRAVKFEKVSGDVRLVEIVDFDLSACAGTHFPQTGMLGLLKILKVENYKGGSRVHFAVGSELVAQFRHYHQTLEAVSNLLSSGTDKVYELVEKLQTERSDLAKQVTSQQQGLLTYEAQDLLKAASGKVVTTIFENRSNDDLRTLANLLTEREGSIAVLINQTGVDVTLIVATNENNEIHAGNTLRTILAEFDGRGGGRETYAQGILKNFGDTDTLIRSISKYLSK